ncbi:MAG TPA: RIO1 family regulatory kinase/ATPase [Kofleriaceae bacterium]|nr:RIO1 family regulatory kinase/ATPase [Kofleriaceae bacterium]
MKGGALGRLGLALVALSPVAAAGWLGAAWARGALGDPARVRRTLERLGIVVGERAIRCERLGHGNMNAVFKVTLSPRGDGAPETLVLKHMLGFGTLLGWGGRELGTMREHPRAIGRAARFHREHAALVALAGAGIRVPRVLGACADEHVIALEWIDGLDLGSALHDQPALAHALGALLRRIHAAGYAMGDANPRNLLVAGGALVPIDLETSHAHATPRQQGFDLAWAAAFLPDAARAELFAGYGARAPVLDAAITDARAHLDRFWPLVDLFAARWRRSQSGPAFS